MIDWKKYNKHIILTKLTADEAKQFKRYCKEFKMTNSRVIKECLYQYGVLNWGYTDMSEKEFTIEDIEAVMDTNWTCKKKLNKIQDILDGAVLEEE